jgi:hypothetical protein
METLDSKLRAKIEEVCQKYPKMRIQNEVAIIQWQIESMLCLINQNLGLSKSDINDDSELAQLLGCETEFIAKLKNREPNSRLSLHQIARLALMFGKVPVIEFRDKDPKKDYGGVVTQAEELTAILRTRIPKKE